MSISAAGRSRQDSKPIGALLLGIFGAGLISVQSWATLVVGGLIQAPQYEGLGLSVSAMGGIGLVEGVSLAVLSVFVYFRSRTHVVTGIAMISLALLSLYSGGGVFLGAFLCWVGGVLAIIHRPAPWVEGTEGITSDDIREDPVIEADLADAGMLGVAPKSP